MALMAKEKGVPGRKKAPGLIFRTWRRCRSLGKSKSGRVAPEGCFWVRVGEEKRKFCIRTECLNHPLFKVLLEEAESEYGFTIDGPLELPCQVDSFIKVLLEMESSWEDDNNNNNNNNNNSNIVCHRPSPRCITFSRSSNNIISYHLLPSPGLMMAFNKVY